jgi:hypothetical protein
MFPRLRSSSNNVSLNSVLKKLQISVSDVPATSVPDSSELMHQLTLRQLSLILQTMEKDVQSKGFHGPGSATYQSNSSELDLKERATAGCASAFPLLVVDGATRFWYQPRPSSKP